MSSGTYRQTLAHRGFSAFLWTQFLGAFNDNVFKIVVSLVAVSTVTGAATGDNKLALVGAVFILPFFLFSGYAGQIADRFSKRTVLVVTKAFEIAVMGLGIAALATGRFDAMLGVLFLLAVQATFFSPAKYGILPEMLPDSELSRANGLLEMSTFVAIILGTSIASFMYAGWHERLPLVGIVLTALAIVGFITSLRVPRVAAAAGDGRSFRLNPISDIVQGCRHLYSNRALWLTVVGISYFWFLGALLQMVVILYGKETLRVGDFWIGILGMFLAIGIAIGSLATGRLSGDKVELGLVPLGSIGMGVFAIGMGSAAPSYVGACTWLLLLGFFSGLFIVPLNALLQQKAGTDEKGRLMASNNVLNMAGILLASGALWLMHDVAGVSPQRIVLVSGLFTLAGNLYVLSILPDFLIRFVLWLFTHTIYRIRIAGQEHVPFRGPALLVCNHMSQVDGFLVGACVQRFVRFMVYRPYYELKAFNWILRLMKAIPVAAGSRRDILASIQSARDEIRRGHVVCIFAEGSISRTGNMLPFKRGFERIVEDLDVPVIPVHIDGLWGSIFSFKDGKFFWKWPERIPYPVTVTFGVPLPSNVTAEDTRQAVMELGSDAMSRRIGRDAVLPRRFVRVAHRHLPSLCMADSTGKELSYGKALIASIALSRWVRRNCGEETMIGIVLPASVGGALANIAVQLAGKVPVNLNFTAGREAMAAAIAQCPIKTVLTSRVFIAKARLDDVKLEELATVRYMEDAMREITATDRALVAACVYLMPRPLLERLFVHAGHDPDALATVMFSSGSSGAPKGVMLSHRNVLANIEAMKQVFWVTGKDRLMGVLPFFHSFGFTGTLWFPLLSGFGAVYHANPTEAKTVGEMVHKYRATLMMSTPTFYSAYTRKCSAEEFASLRYAVVGAEKLREPIARAFREKYNLELLEGYGCTEMAPVVAVNTAGYPAEGQKGLKAGTVGHPLPGVVAKLVHPETREPLPSGAEGLLLVKGPNRMMGYLGDVERTRDVLVDGWYVTGDIATIDEDGFIRITDRLSRFSKIAGEMVPHIKIEQTITNLLDDPTCVVVAVPDEAKGERLVAFYTRCDVSPHALWEQLSVSGLPKLWLPKRENLHCVETVPLLASGKVDLRAMQALARNLVPALLQ